MQYRRPIIIAGLLTALAAPVGFAQPPSPTPARPPQQQTRPTPGKAPADPKADAPAVEFTTAGELLDALETADKKIKTISADLNFTTVAGEIEGSDKQIRNGKIWFRNRTPTPAQSPGSSSDTPETTPRSPTHAAASVQFQWLYLPGSGNKRVPENKTYIVDGPVMVEKITDEKLVNRYKLASGAQQDPLKLGEGPFPLPFGQQRDEVLARFEARLAPPLETMDAEVETLRQRLGATYQLVLLPKKDAGVSSNVKEIRVWYQKKDLLPTLARIVRPDGGFDEFFLIGVQVNKPLPANVFDTSVPAGWRVQEKEKP